MINALTIDVEDYYMVSGFADVVKFEDWHKYESRVERNTIKLLEILDEYKVKATFFILGWIAEKNPALVKDIHNSGHEVACHSYNHRLVYDLTPEEFREDIRRAKGILEDITGRPVIGFRAPSYSITGLTFWCLDVLHELGFRYDSSIFPIHHDRYGIPNYRRFPHCILGEGENALWEFPLSTLRWGKMNIPIAGGGYFRLFPYSFVRWGIRRINEKEQAPAIVYLHPWEIDPSQPRVNGSWLSRFRHYVNLGKTESRLRRLLRDFQFGSFQMLITSDQEQRDHKQEHRASAVHCWKLKQTYRGKM